MPWPASLRAACCECSSGSISQRINATPMCLTPELLLNALQGCSIVKVGLPRLKEFWSDATGFHRSFLKTMKRFLALLLLVAFFGCEPEPRPSSWCRHAGRSSARSPSGPAHRGPISRARDRGPGPRPQPRPIIVEPRPSRQPRPEPRPTPLPARAATPESGSDPGPPRTGESKSLPVSACTNWLKREFS